MAPCSRPRLSALADFVLAIAEDVQPRRAEGDTREDLSRDARQVHPARERSRKHPHQDDDREREQGTR